MSKPKHKAEYGDFQTPLDLAQQVCELLVSKGVKPATVIEPTCGMGNFLVAAVEHFPEVEQLFGLEINARYIESAKEKLKLLIAGRKVKLLHEDFFQAHWLKIIQSSSEPILVLGNPPWITSSELGVLESKNLPRKGNHEGLTGLEALTGKSNFDISEWMLLRICELLDGRNAILAILCKTAVARKILSHAWKKHFHLRNAELFQIEAETHFNASVDACLLFLEFRPSSRCKNASVYQSLEDRTASQNIGFRKGKIIADIVAFERWKHLQGTFLYDWRSGIKHDCSKVMEFIKKERHYCNGLGETVELEDDYVYPMLKSSNLANGTLTAPDRWMLVTQKKIGNDTDGIRSVAPKTWNYLQEHSRFLDKRRSSIYRKQPRYSIFGVGEYSFSPWKVAVSGFYKTLQFRVVGSFSGKPIVLDDTCYFIPCESKEEAESIESILNSVIAKEYLSSFIFWDAKRPITKELLQNLDLLLLAREYGVEDDVLNHTSRWAKLNSVFQTRLFD